MDFLTVWELVSDWGDVSILFGIEWCFRDAAEAMFDVLADGFHLVGSVAGGDAWIVGVLHLEFAGR